LSRFDSAARPLKSSAKTTRADAIPFDVFICYKRVSGEDFAEHLKAGLEELGVRTFLDTKDIPEKFKGTEKWTDARDKAVVESKTFLLILTPGFELSPEIKKELSLARKYANKEFVYFRHRDLTPSIKIILENEELDLRKQQQISFDTKNDLLRKAYRVLIEGNKAPGTISNASEKTTDKKILDAISNLAAFYDTVLGARKVQKVYPKLFTAAEMNSPGKADKICRVLENYLGNKVQFKQALQTIINLHRDYSLNNIIALRDIVTDLGFIVGNNLSLSEKGKLLKQNSTKEIVKKYNAAIIDTNTNDPLPFKACPKCGSTKLKRGSIHIGDDYFFTIECTECGWSEGSE